MKLEDLWKGFWMLRTASSPINETYFDVQRLIFKLSWRFISRYGGDFEEIVSESNSLFVQAYDEFIPGQCKFSTWISRRIWNGLLDYRKREKRHKFIHLEDIEEWNLPAVKEDTAPNRIHQMLFDTSEDCQNIIHLILKTPEDLGLKFSINTLPKTLQNGLADFLFHKCGWTMERIKRAFREIVEILHG